MVIFAESLNKRNPCTLYSHSHTYQFSGCSSAWLEYTSGGRGVASSNLAIPTKNSLEHRARE